MRSRCPPGNLERRTAHSPVDRAQFDHALVEVRRRGWAASLDELELGLTAVGAPVRTVDGTVVAAVSVSGPTNRINEYGITQLGDLLVAELRGLSALLGHQPAEKEGVGMTDHAEILRGLYDETLVGNKPRVLELTHEGLATGLTRRRCCSTR